MKKKTLGKRLLSTALALVMVLGMLPMSAFAAEVGDTATTTTATAPADEDKAVWVLDEGTLLNPNPSTTCGENYHEHGQDCNYTGCEHYQRELAHQNYHALACYDEEIVWVKCPQNHTHTVEESGYSVYMNSELKSAWEPVYQDAANEWAAKHSVSEYTDTTVNIMGKEVVIVSAQSKYDAAKNEYAIDVVKATTFCFTATTEPICGHESGSCPDTCCSLQEHVHDVLEGGCYEYRWTLYADVNNNDEPDGVTEWTVTFNANGGEGTYENQTVLDTATATEVAAPTRTGYTFNGWSPALTTEISTDTTFVAQWDADEYTVTWNNEDGTLYTETKADYDSVPEAPAGPAKDPDAQYSYTFAGWTPEIHAVNGNDVYTATYSSTVNEYTVTFENEDGTELQSGKVAYGETPAYTGETPTKAADAQYTYTFAGWNPDVDTVTGAVTYTAKYTSTVNKYTVTWVNADSTVLEKDENVEYGTTPTYDGATPTKAADAQSTYTFAGWDPTIGEVTGDVTYTAVFTPAADVVARIGTTNFFATWAEAYDAAQPGDTIVLLKDITVSSKVIINKAITVDGQDEYSFIADAETVWYTTSGKLQIKKYAPWVLLQADGITFENLTINSNNCAGGVKIENAENVVFDNVTILGAVADAVTVVGSLDLETYFKAETSSSVIDARNGVVTAASKTEFDLAKWSSNVSPATSDLTGAVNAEGELFFCAYDSNTYYYDGVKKDSLPNELTLLKDTTISPTVASVTSISVSGTNTIDLGGYTLTVADGKAITVNGALTVENEGAIEGSLVLGSTAATITASAGWDNITSGVDGLKALDMDGVYRLGAAVTWLDGDNDEIYSEDYVYGEPPVYDEETYGKPGKSFNMYDEERLAYEWDGTWSPAITAVTGDVTYTANFTEKRIHYVHLVVGEDTYLVRVIDGDKIPTGAYTTIDTTMDGYRFDGWYAEGETEEFDFTQPITADITVTAKFSQYVAEVNGTQYVTLKEAVGAANSGDTITVLASHTLPAMVWVGYEAKDAKVLTIDLGGNTVSFSNTAIMVQRSGSQVTFVNGTISGNGSAGSIKVSNSGKVVLGKDAVVACSGGSATAIKVEAGSLVVTKGARVTNDAKILGTKVGVIVAEDAKGVEIYGGSFVGPIQISNAENVVIQGGYFSDENVANYVFPGYALEEDVINDDAMEETGYKVVNHDTVNNNGVKDEDETVTVTIVGNGTVNGNAETFTVVYDSVNETTISINAVPSIVDGVSKSYVSSITANGVEQALTYENYSVTLDAPVEGHNVVVTFAEAKFTYNDERLLNYYDGMPGVKNEDVYNSVVENPELGADSEFTIQYKAREAMSQTVYVESVISDPAIVAALKTFGLESMTFDMPELWREVNVEITDEDLSDSVSLDAAVGMYMNDAEMIKLYNKAQGAYDAAYKAYIEEHGEGIFGANKVVAAGYGLAAAKDAVEKDVEQIYENVYGAAMYYEAHNFGHNATGEETVTEDIKVTYKDATMYIEGQTTVTLKDLRAASYIVGEDVSVVYKDYTDEDLIDLIGATVTDEDGNVIEGATVSCADITDPYTFESKGVVETAYELTFKFKGNETYKPAEETFAVTVTKAPITTFDVPNVTVTYNEAYSMAPTVVLGNQYGEVSEVTDSMIQFLVGLDIAELDVDADGVHGLNGKVQLMLPGYLQSMLDSIIGATGNDVNSGVEMSLSDLMGYLEPIEDSSVDSLKQALTAIQGITETGDITITIGGALPTDIGAYLYGAVTTSSNYETAYDVAYIVIKPVATQVYLDWNYTDPNGLYTWELLQHIDMEASAYNEATFATLNSVATEQVNELFFGIDDQGNVVAELNTITNPEDLGNGAFLELAFIAEFGNEFYYAVPIVRPVVIIPNAVDVEIVDANENGVLLREFDNTAKDVDVELNYDGTALTLDRANLTVNYVGVQTNTKTYELTTEAPTHAGAYVVTATYVEKNAAGEIIGLGLDVATLVIEPSESTIDVAEKVVEKGEVYDLEKTLVTVDSVNSDLNPDTTIISAAIASDGTFSENGWEAIEGSVNVDFPKWLDEFLSEHAPDVMASGITVGQLTAKLNERVDYYADKLVELGATEEIANVFTDLIGNVTKVLAEMPEDTTLTFADDVTVSNVGAYAVIGIVTDSDHYPSVDAGLLVIVPAVTQVELKWNHDDENFIWTHELLKYFDVYASAYDKESGELDDKATGEITHQFITIDENGELVVLTDPENLPNGAYIELAYIELQVDGDMVISDMIARPIVIVPSTVTIEFIDKDGNVNPDQKFVFDNTAKAMGTRITINGDVLENPGDALTVTYVGVQTNGKEYNDTVAPTHAGVYLVTATYADYAEDGSLTHMGVAIGVMAIEPAESTIDVTGMAGDDAITYDGEEHGVSTGDVTVTVTGGYDYTLISGGAYVEGNIDEIGVDAFVGNVNIDFPVWLDKAIAEGEYEFAEGVDKDYLVRFIKSYRDDVMALIPVEELAATGLITEEEINDYIAKLNAYIDELLPTLEKLPENVTLTFENDVTYAEPGYYFYYGIVTDSDHYPSTDTGLLVIEKMDMVFDLLNTTETYDGEEQFVNVNNTQNADYVTVIIDRAENAMNILIDEDAQYLLNSLLRVMDEEFDGDVSLSTILEKYNGAEVAAALVSIIDELKTLDLDNEVAKALDAVKTELETLPKSGKVVINGALPTEVGEYEVYAVSYSEYYTTQASEADLIIKPVQVEVVLDDNSKVYGETDPELTYTVNYYDHEGNKLADAGIATVVVTRAEGENVDTYAITATVTLSDDKNYVLIAQPKAADFEITPAEITIKVDDKSKTYGEADPEWTYTITKGALVNNDTALNVTYSRAEGENAGKYVITAKDNDANYTITIEDGTLNIKPIEITVTLKNAEKVYGDADPKVEYSYEVTAGQMPDGSMLVIGTDMIRVNEGENVGEYEFTNDSYVFFGGDNYKVTVKNATLTITKATVTVDVNDATKKYGEADPALTYTVSGLVNGDTADKLNIVVTRKDGEDVGNYAITATASNDNYNITVVDGTLTITAKAITADDVTLDGELTYNGSEQTQNVKVTEGITYEVTGNKRTNAGNYTLTVTGTGNYDGTVTKTWTIAPKNIGDASVIVTLGETLTYTGSAQTQGFSVTDTAITPAMARTVGTTLTKGTDYTVSGDEQTNAGTYTLTVSGTGNYTGRVEVDWTIAEKAATITANDVEMTQYGSLPELTATVEGTVGNDTLNYTLSLPEGVDGKTAGTYNIVVTLGENPNYEVTITNGTLTVISAVASITVEKKTTYYATLQEAVNAAKDGDTIVLLQNVESDAAAVNYSGGEKIVTLDLKDHTVIALSDHTMTSYSKKPTLIIVDSVGTGAIYANDKGHGIVFQSNLIIDGVKVVKSTSKDPVVMQGSGTLEVKGEAYIDGNMQLKGTSNTTITSGTVTGAIWLKDDKPTLTITGGTFQGEIFKQVDGATIKISGGTFSYKPNAEWIVDGYCAKYNGDENGTWTVGKEVALEAVQENYVASTFDAVGGYDMVTYCGHCGEELSREHTVIEKLIAVAQNKETSVRYEKLSDAIAAVKNGETIVMLADIDEDVTIKQVKNVSFTIDGEGKTYSGTMTIDGNKRSNGAETLTITDVKFVAEGKWQSSIETKKNTYAHNITVDGCTFTGTDAKQAYGIRLRHAYNITVKNTTGTKLYDLVYGNNTVTGFTAEKVTVTDSGMGFWLPYGIKLNFKGVATTNVGTGIGIRNNNASEATFENCDTNVYFEQQVNEDGSVVTKTYKLYFYDATNELEVGDNYDKLTVVLNKVDTTVACENADLNAITTEDLNKTYKVVYEDGVYKLVERVFVAQIGETKYESIQEAVNAAQDDDIIIVIADHEIGADVVNEKGFGYETLIIVDGKAVTIDFAGHTVTVKHGDASKYAKGIASCLEAVVFVYDNASLTLTDLTENAKGGFYIPANDKVSIYSMVYNCGGDLTVKAGTYTMVKGHAAASIIYAEDAHDTSVSGGTFTLGNAGENSDTKPWIFNTEGKNDTFITVTGGTYNQDILMNYGSGKDCEVDIPVTHALVDNGDGTWTVKPKITVKVDDQTKVYGESDPTLTYKAEKPDTSVTVNVIVTRTPGEDVGEYEITASLGFNDAAINDYFVEFIPGTLTITPAQVTITVDNKEMGATDSIPELTYTVSVTEPGAVTAEELDVKLSVDPDKNAAGQIIPGEYDIIATYTDPTDPNNWDVTVVNGTLTVTIGDYVCWNVDTGVYYTDLSDALAETKTEETVQILADKIENELMVLVLPGTTLDLNGKLLITSYMAVFGEIIDGTDGEALMKADNIAVNGNASSYLPIYDVDDVGYRLFYFEFGTYGVGRQTADSAMFACTLKFTNMAAWQALVDDSDGVNLNMVANWGSTSNMNISFESVFDSVAEDALADNAKLMYYFVTLTGLSNRAGNTVVVTPILTSDNLLTVTAPAMSYAIPAAE